MRRRSKTGGKPAEARRRKTTAAHPAKLPAAAGKTEVARLRGELDEALERQTATAEVLSVIASSPHDAQPVFDMIAKNAARLCKAQFCYVFRFDGELVHFAAQSGYASTPEEFLTGYPLPPGRTSAATRSILTGAIEQIPDVLADPGYGHGSQAKALKFRSIVAVPMLKNGRPLGTIAMAQSQAGRFPDWQIDLLRTFADQAAIAIENVRLFNAEQQRTRELSESLEQQTAISDILRAISNSPNDVQAVLDLVAKYAARICEAQVADIVILDDKNMFHDRAWYGELARPTEADVLPLVRTSVMGRAVLDRRPVHVEDLQAAGDEFPLGRVFALKWGHRTILGVPLLRENRALGTILVRRNEVRPFAEKHIMLLQTFAEQAAIAIENARLLSELRQSLEQQTATAEVLRVISSSPSDLTPVFQTILENAVHICEAKFGNLFLCEGAIFRAVAGFHKQQKYSEFWLNQEVDLRENPGIPLDRLARSKQVTHIPDLATDPSYVPINKRIVSLVETAGARTFVAVPMLKEGELIGAIAMYREEVRPFTDQQIELVKNFAAQAVIAIQNTRLLSELRQSLEQQTATADVLRVISSSLTDIAPVFAAILENAIRLCGGDVAALWQFDGQFLRFMAGNNTTPEMEAHVRQRPLELGTYNPTVLAGLERRTVHELDVFGNPNYRPLVPSGTTTRRPIASTVLAVPLLREDKLLGVITIWRYEKRLFTDKQIELVTTFADQAVIAIENARLLNELRQRTDDLTESLEQQTATSEVLKVISSSPGELEPVFNAMLENAVRICDAKFGVLFRYNKDSVVAVAQFGVPPAHAEYLDRGGFRPPPGTSLDRMVRTKGVVPVADAAAESVLSPAAKLGGARSLVAVPMLKEGELIGAFTIYRQEVRPFTDKQIDLVKNFAAQAVIAIENTRLLSELRQRTADLSESLARQTATSEVLGVISRSKFELQPILQSVVDTAARLCHAERAVIFRQDGGVYRFAAGYSLDPAYLEIEQRTPILPGQGTVVGRVAISRQVAAIDDAWTDPLYEAKHDAKIGEVRSMLGVPLMREDEPIGVIALARKRVEPFEKSEIELVTTFADQAVIAIENVRLFESVETRTRELTKSLDDLRTAQDRLVQTEKLASLGQLTAGIAHEIKNPLNFVNNFSAVSVELIEELRESLAGIHLDAKRKADINEIADMLQGNLDKVVQHGKRADSIVKNMLLHSRAGSGEHRPVDINALVEESLNLAYHGARAEKQDFNITLERSFDPAAGEVDLFPQEITRVLLNLISNGFYAATKRGAEANGGDYAPTLTAATCDLGHSVEIRIRDNGTGIPPEVKEKMFNPFFTTKPAGEGTGLGLSLSHDIVVKQHGGTIEVDTEPGGFTEFRIVLPRAAATIAKSGEKT
jgi:GAF domain-containing protein